MICTERIEWIKNSKSLIANRKERDYTGERKNKKRKEEEHSKKNDEDDKEETPASKNEDKLKEKEIENAAKKNEEEDEMRISSEYDAYYDTFIAAVKGSRLYN